MKITDPSTATVLMRTTRPCPRCGLRVSHYKDHGCHRMRCGNSACAFRFCYICLSEVRPDRTDPDDETLETSTCRCPPFCRPDCQICTPCPECTDGKRCAQSMH